MPRFTTLYSGSSGNAGVVEQDGRYLLVDMGCSCRATLQALAEAGLAPEGLCGILVTHEHIDHIRGLNVFLKRHPVPLYASIATLDALWRMDVVHPTTEMVAVDSREEQVGPFVVRGFATSHDAAGCCGFRVTAPAGQSMAIATDLGVVSKQVFSELLGVDLVALEANYDVDALRFGPYPPRLKQRIASPMGHLSNTESAKTIALLMANGCKKVALCHLSEQNNTPALVQQALKSALFEVGLRPDESCTLQISRRHNVSPWISF